MNNPFDLIDARLSNIETLILDIKHKPISQPTKEVNPVYLRSKSVQKILGISYNTLNRLVNSGIITRYNIGKSIRYKKSEVLAAAKIQDIEVKK